MDEEIVYALLAVVIVFAVFFGFWIIIWRFVKRQKKVSRITIVQEDNVPVEPCEEEEDFVTHTIQPSPFLSGEQTNCNRQRSVKNTEQASPQEEVSAEQNQFALELDNPEEVKKAVIYSEILTPKF